MVYNSTFNFSPRNELLYLLDKTKELIQKQSWRLLELFIFPGREVTMLTSKAFSSTFQHGMLVQEEAFMLFLHFTHGNPEEGTIYP